MTAVTEGNETPLLSVMMALGGNYQPAMVMEGPILILMMVLEIKSVLLMLDHRQQPTHMTVLDASSQKRMPLVKY